MSLLNRASPRPASLYLPWSLPHLQPALLSSHRTCPRPPPSHKIPMTVANRMISEMSLCEGPIFMVCPKPDQYLVATNIHSHVKLQKKKKTPVSYSEWICNAKWETGGTVREQQREAAERGRARNATVVMGVREGCSGWEHRFWMGSAGSCTESQELAWIQPANMLPRHTITLTLSSDRMPQMKKSLFSRLTSW